MRIKEISYKRLRNLGNYETSSLEGTVEINPEEDPHVAFEWLRNYVHFKLGLITEEDFNRLTDKKEII